MTPESEDLPANVDGRIFLRTMGRCDGKGLKYSVVSIYAVPGNGVFFMPFYYTHIRAHHTRHDMV